MSGFARRGLYTVTRGMGLHALLRRRQRHRLLVLNYHSVLPADRMVVGDDSFRNAVSETEFEAQLQWLLRAYQPVSVEQVDDWMGGRAGLAPRSLLVTFDDGMRNNAEVAAPLLERLGVPALFLVTTGYLGTGDLLWTDELSWRVEAWPERTLPLPREASLPGRASAPDQARVSLPSSRAGRQALARTLRARCKRLGDADRRGYLQQLQSATVGLDRPEALDALGFMDWAQARSLARRGFAIGSHTVRHRILSRLTPEEAREELAASRRRIEAELDAPCPWVAYPNGCAADVGPAIEAMAAECGYRLGFTTEPRHARAGARPLGIGRISVPARRPDPVFDAIVCGLDARLRF